MNFTNPSFRGFLLLFISLLSLSCGSSQKVKPAARQKQVPDTSYGAEVYYQELYGTNNYHVSQFTPSNIRAYPVLQRVRTAEKLKGFLSDVDVLWLMGKPNSSLSTKAGKNTVNGEWDARYWIYEDYLVSFVVTSTKLNQKRTSKSRVASSLGLGLVFNDVSVR